MIERGRDSLPAWQPWAALASFAFLLNFPWEMLQTPFYVGMTGAPHWEAMLVCLRASGGDVLILLTAYGSVAAVAGRDWLTRPGTPHLTAFVGMGLLITAVIELVSVHLLDRWAYAEGVPVLMGVGLPPILQWLLLPPLALWLTRRHIG